MWVDWIWEPSGNPPVMPWFVQRFLVHGIWVPRKWLVHPDSVMAQVSQAGRVSGTTTLIPEMEVKENFL